MTVFWSTFASVKYFTWVVDTSWWGLWHKTTSHKCFIVLFCLCFTNSVYFHVVLCLYDPVLISICSVEEGCLALSLMTSSEIISFLFLYNLSVILKSVVSSVIIPEFCAFQGTFSLKGLRIVCCTDCEVPQSMNQSPWIIVECAINLLSLREVLVREMSTYLF